MDNTKNTELKSGFEYFINELLKISKVHNILYFEYKKNKVSPSRYDANDGCNQIDVKIKYK